MTDATFKELLAYDCKKFIDKVKVGNTELKYLSWSCAWAEFVKFYPDANYNIKLFADDKGIMKPFIKDDELGYLVFTSVTAGGITKEMWLPVMDGANKAMKNNAYSYFVKNKYGDGKPIEKKCEAATMFDINKTLMRCLTKNLAMFGLGLYIYQGEDLPTPEEEQEHNEEPKTIKKTKKEDPADSFRKYIDFMETAEFSVLLSEKFKARLAEWMLRFDEAGRQDLSSALSVKYNSLLSADNEPNPIASAE